MLSRAALFARQYVGGYKAPRLIQPVRKLADVAHDTSVFDTEDNKLKEANSKPRYELKSVDKMTYILKTDVDKQTVFVHEANRDNLGRIVGRLNIIHKREDGKPSFKYGGVLTNQAFERMLAQGMSARS